MDAKKILLVLVCISTSVFGFAVVKKVKQRQQIVLPPVTSQVSPLKIPEQPAVLTQKDCSELIQETDCKEILTWLAADEREGRMSGKKGNEESADYIEKKFR